MVEEYRGYLIEKMFRWYRVSKNNKIVAKLFTDSIKEVRHEMDNVIKYNEQVVQNMKDKLNLELTKKW